MQSDRSGRNQACSTQPLVACQQGRGAGCCTAITRLLPLVPGCGEEEGNMGQDRTASPRTLASEVSAQHSGHVLLYGCHRPVDTFRAHPERPATTCIFRTPIGSSTPSVPSGSESGTATPVKTRPHRAKKLWNGSSLSALPPSARTCTLTPHHGWAIGPDTNGPALTRTRPRSGPGPPHDPPAPS